MVFSSIFFMFGFMPIFFLIYYVLPYKYKNVWALLGSTFFYAWGGPAFVLVLFASITADYFIGHQIAQNKGQSKRRWVALGLILNVGLLGYFKYANFFVENFNSLLMALGMTGVHWTDVALPIGISFFTFQKISYLIDVSRGEKEAMRNWVDYALFVVLFPQLIAGPIVRFKDIADEIVDRRANLIPSERLLGIYRFIIGLAKKVLIANVLGEVADHYYNDVSDPNFGEAWIALAAYTFQIYFDFSGYSDMAIGLGRMMGFRFPENFNYPYISKSITEFWRRWHITLSSWMRDYLYIPLGGNRGSVSRTYVNLWLVFLMSGLWHGASWNFVIWGAFHGFWLVTERAFLLKWMSSVPAFVRIVFTFFIAMLGWLVFRLEDADTFTIYLNAMCSRNGWPTIDPHQWVILALAIFLSFRVAFIRSDRTESTPFESLNPRKAIRITLVSLVLLSLSASFVMSSDFNPFIYFRF
ncbi:MAG: MBOAT family protein [Bacteroidetes bacterium]|nr:MAG: MBOAT family protein [Bacteroidota bacterium]